MQKECNIFYKEKKQNKNLLNKKKSLCANSSPFYLIQLATLL